MIRRVLLSVLLCALCLVGWPLAGRAQTPPPAFRIGVAPHTSARAILEQYQPIRQALETALGQPVEILTAPDFTEFARRAVDQGYDIAITTGHQAWLLEKDAQYRPLVTYKADFKAVAVVSKTSPAHQPHDLDGTTVIGLSPSSLVTIWGQHWLRTNNVANVRLRYVSAADSVGQLLLAGEASAGFMSLANFQGLAPDVRDRLTFLAESETMAGRIYMLNHSQGEKYNVIMTTLTQFAATPEGARYFEQYKLGGYRPVPPGELAPMEPYSNEVRQLLRAAPK